MTARLATPADDVTVAAIWAANYPTLAGVFTQLPAVIDPALYRVPPHLTWVSETGGGIRGVFIVARHGLGATQPINLRDEAIIGLVTTTGGASARRSRFRQAMKECMVAWVANAAAAGVIECHGWYPVAGLPVTVEYLNHLAAAAGVAVDTTSRAGWYRYSYDPAMLAAALNLVVV